jgi:signal transduction histidine kinase
MGLEPNFRADIDAIGAIDAIPTILNVVCRVTGMRFAAVARVTQERWICCAVQDEIAFGLQPGGELTVETTICHEVRQSRDAVVIDHVAEDELYCKHHTPAMYGFQSYISMPIFQKDGRFFGTLCAIDPEPHRLRNPETVGMFKLFADLIAFYLDASERLASSEASLLDERNAAELREQFIAVLGHDLRNPLASIAAGTRLLQKTPLNEKAVDILGMMQSSVNRMSGIINNVVDLARGRLGGGLNLDRSIAPLQPVLEQVVAEFRMSQPERPIETRFALDRPVDCDRVRIAQLASNLLGNALTYGKPGEPIRIDATTDATNFTLSIANAGEPIAPGALEHLFLPFFRGAVQPNQPGLGLGLYIASEIARAHAGTIEAASTAAETRFTFRMPISSLADR